MKYQPWETTSKILERSRNSIGDTGAQLRRTGGLRRLSARRPHHKTWRRRSVRFGRAFWATRQSSAWILLPWLTAPWAVILMRRMATCADGAIFNATLRDTARLHGVFGLLLAAGIVL